MKRIAMMQTTLHALELPSGRELWTYRASGQPAAALGLDGASFYVRDNRGIAKFTGL